MSAFAIIMPNISHRHVVGLIFIILSSLFFLLIGGEERNPTRCEACKLLSREIEEMLHETSSSEVLELGHRIGSDKPKQKRKYAVSEVRLVEVTDQVCQRLRAYKIHSEHNNLWRYQREQSSTIKELNKLRARGVQVEIGMPWEIVDDEVPREVRELQRLCNDMVEEYEDDISSWFFANANSVDAGTNYPPLSESLCRKLFHSPATPDVERCLKETFYPPPGFKALSTEDDDSGNDEL